jgi:hypothetical protein
MSQHIREVLNRRTDLSTFVVHLTRDDDPFLAEEPLTARRKLDQIIGECGNRRGGSWASSVSGTREGPLPRE